MSAVEHSHGQDDKVVKLSVVTSISDGDYTKRIKEAGGYSADEIDDIELPEPKYGEEIVGHLTPEEAAMFVAFQAVQEEAESKQRAIGGSLLIDLGKRVQGGEEVTSINTQSSVNQDDARECFKLERKLAMLKSSFYWMVCERIGYWDYTIGVRTKRRVVKTERRW